MSRINKSTARKVYQCGNCGVMIGKGEEYYWSSVVPTLKVVRCLDCGMKDYDLTLDKYIQVIGRLQDKWEVDYPINEGNLEVLISDLVELKEGIETKLAKMTSKKSRNTAKYFILTERLKSLSSAVESLGGIDFEVMYLELEESIEGRSEIENTLIDNVRHVINDTISEIILY